MSTVTAVSLSGRRVLVVSRRDIGHPEAAGPEEYLHEIARRWVAAGALVTWLASRPRGAAARAVVDGVEVLRSRGALRLLSRGERIDAVVDATDRMAFAMPLIAGRRVPVVRVAHPQCRPTTGVGRLRWLSRLLTGSAARGVRAVDPIVAMSTSARDHLRRHLEIRGSIFVVPAGTPTAVEPGERANDPTVVVDTHADAQQGTEALLRELVPVLAEVPRLRVEILGDGPQLARLRRLAHDTGLAAAVTLHGRMPRAERDAWLRRGWLAVSTEPDMLCGCAVLRAAAHGVPCLALDGPGVREFVREGRTGHVVDTPGELGRALVRQLGLLADDEYAQRTAERCRAWAACFQWNRSARLLANIVEDRLGAQRFWPSRTERRYARSDIATLVQLPDGVPAPIAARRTTDEVSVSDGVVSVLLNGCDEVDALGVLERLGVDNATVRLAHRDDLLIGPTAAASVGPRIRPWTVHDEPRTPAAGPNRGPVHDIPETHMPVAAARSVPAHEKG